MRRLMIIIMFKSTNLTVLMELTVLMTLAVIISNYVNCTVNNEADDDNDDINNEVYVNNFGQWLTSWV